MDHPPFPGSAAAREIQAVQHLRHLADRHGEPAVRQTLSGAVELIVELIEQRGRRRDFNVFWDRPTGGG